MTENTATFKLPAADELCTALRAAVTKLGGDARQFFEKLGAESEGFVDEFAPDDWPMRQLLVRCLENITFRGRLLAQISADDDRDFLSNFLDAWDVWKEIEPFDHNWIVLVFAGPHLETLFGPIPDRANEIFRCISSLQLGTSGRSPTKRFVEDQAAMPSSWKTPCMAV
jgi:hypothetical protein